MNMITQQKQKIINHLNLIPENRLKEVDMFIRFILYEAKQSVIQNTENINEEYSNLNFLSAQQNNELKHRLESLENKEMNFYSLEDFKEKYKHYI